MTSTPVIADSNKDFHVHVLKDGGYVLSCGPNDDYGYESKEALLAALSAELGGEDSGEDEDVVDDSKEKKKNVKKILEDEDED